MSISRTKKEEIVLELHEKIAQSSAILLADHTGLKVKDITVLRRKLQDISVEYRVIKNNLARRAVKDTGKDQLGDFFDGPNSMVFLSEDVVEGAKVLLDFYKEHERPEIKIGFVEDRLYDRNELISIAKLPPRDILLTKVAGGLISPVNKFALLMTELIASFVRAVDAVKVKKESTGE
jgi:large subunit ribosomal protein L10